MLTLYVSNRNGAEAQLDLPMPLDEIKQQLEALRVKGYPKDGLSVRNAACPIPGIGWHLQPIRIDSDPTLEKLNQLADMIGGMNEAGHYLLFKALRKDYQLDLDYMLRTAAHIDPGSMDRYEVIPGITTHQALGRWLVEHERLEERVPETVRPYLDYNAIGIDYCNKHDGELLSTGYTGIRKEVLEQAREEKGIIQLTLATSKTTHDLCLPASNERLEQAKKALDVEDFSQTRICKVEFFETCPDDLIPLDGITVSNANDLAVFIEQMIHCDGDFMKYLAVLSAESPETLTDALRLAMDIDDYELVPEDHAEYGEKVLRRLGVDDKIMETLAGFMDFTGLGKESMETDGVRRTEFGLVRRLSAPFPEPEVGQMMM